MQTILDRFNMRGYFTFPKSELKGAVCLLWRLVVEELPQVADGFDEDEDDRPLFRHLMQHWLQTFFVCSVGKQSFAQFTPLLHGIVCSDNPLEPIDVAFAALRRHEDAFGEVCNYEQLVELVDSLTAELKVDAELLRLARGHEELAEVSREKVREMYDKLSLGAGDNRCFRQIGRDTVGFGRECPFRVIPGQDIVQRFPITWGGQYRLRLTLEGVTWQAPDADAIHSVPVIVGVRPAPGFLRDEPPNGHPIHGFYITRTANRALWGVATSDGATQFVVGCLSRKIQFDLLLKLLPGDSSLDFIYNNSTLGSISWHALCPVNFLISAPMYRNARADTFLLDQSQKVVSRLDLGPSIKNVQLEWVDAKAVLPTYERMLPRIFISKEDKPRFILRDKSNTIRGFEFPTIGPGQEIEQEKGVIAPGIYRLKIKIEGLKWNQGNQVLCPVRTETRLLDEYPGENMALFVGMRFVEYFGIYIYKADGKQDKFSGFVSSDPFKRFELQANGGNVELTFVLEKQPRSSALVSNGKLSVYCGDQVLVAGVPRVVSSLIPASFRVKNGMLVRTVNGERHVYGSSCSLKFEWESVAKDLEDMPEDVPDHIGGPETEDWFSEDPILPIEGPIENSEAFQDRLELLIAKLAEKQDIPRTVINTLQSKVASLVEAQPLEPQDIPQGLVLEAFQKKVVLVIKEAAFSEEEALEAFDAVPQKIHLLIEEAALEQKVSLRPKTGQQPLEENPEAKAKNLN